MPGGGIDGKRLPELVLWENCVAGSVAGGLAAAVTTPLDVVKTRLMTQSASDAGRYKGVVDALRRIAQEEGTAALFSGIGPRVMWIALGGSIFFGAFEELSRRLRGAVAGGGREAPGGAGYSHSSPDLGHAAKASGRPTQAPGLDAAGSPRDESDGRQ